MRIRFAAWLAAATLAFPLTAISQGNAELMAERRAAAFALNERLLERLLAPSTDRTVFLHLKIPGAEHLRTPLADRPLDVREFRVLGPAIADRFDAANDRKVSAGAARPYVPFDFPEDTNRLARGW